MKSACVQTEVRLKKVRSMLSGGCCRGSHSRMKVHRVSTDSISGGERRHANLRSDPLARKPLVF